MAPCTAQNRYRNNDDANHEDEDRRTANDGLLEARAEHIQVAKQLFSTSSQTTSHSSFPSSIMTTVTPPSPRERTTRDCIPFSIQKYDNVLHCWNKKPFVKDRIRTFFGSVRQDRMEQKLEDRQKAISHCGDPTVCDPEGLVLTDVSRPFQSKLLFSVSHTTDVLLQTQQVKYVSGTWLSRVYCGNCASCFLDWIEDAADYCKTTYGKSIRPPRDFYVYYPSERRLSETPFKGDSLVVFFIKLKD